MSTPCVWAVEGNFCIAVRSEYVPDVPELLVYRIGHSGWLRLHFVHSANRRYTRKQKEACAPLRSAEGSGHEGTTVANVASPATAGIALAPRTGDGGGSGPALHLCHQQPQRAVPVAEKHIQHLICGRYICRRQQGLDFGQSYACTQDWLETASHRWWTEGTHTRRTRTLQQRQGLDKGAKGTGGISWR